MAMGSVNEIHAQFELAQQDSEDPFRISPWARQALWIPDEAKNLQVAPRVHAHMGARSYHGATTTLFVIGSTCQFDV